MDVFLSTFEEMPGIFLRSNVFGGFTTNDRSYGIQWDTQREHEDTP